MSRSIKKKIRIRILVIMILFILVILFTSVIFLRYLCRRYFDDITSNAAYFAEAVIDPDSAGNYLITRKTDAEYNAAQNKLKQYADNEKWVDRICLISYSNSYGYYIYDTDNKPIGTKIKYDEYTESVKAELINGRKKWNYTRANCYYIFYPIRTTDDKLAGYIIVETDKSFYTQYLFITSGVFIGLLFVLLVFCISLSGFMNKEIFNPIKLLSKRALDYTGSVPTDDDLNTEQFLIDKDDEIGDLSKAIRKMMNDINNSTENLSQSIYEATHDVMTQVYNKRHYNNMVENFRNCQSICVIYFDVNNLKLMNDTHGHDHGDQVIRAAAEYIGDIIGEDSFCFRMGGDEFLLVMTDCMFKEIDRIIEKLDKDSPIILSSEEDSVKCALSYGYAYAKGYYIYEQLLSEAEENMYRKKAELKELLDMPDR